MAALKHEVKSFIVQALACFDTPSQVVEQVKQEFSIEISRQQCESHDPTKRAGVNLAARWVTLFHDTRKRFREDTAEIPIANRAYRLRALGRIVEKAESMRNLALALQVLEQAAKESGDMYVNRHRKDEPSDEPAIPTRIQVDVVDARKPDAEP
ncbi:DUF2280 domain-containing protein [Pseudomonas syringae pv. syringae]|uniref:DUF2280 domain-containing protein n=1 Tax=Pseudomonas TaxID=286 RepID=UPI0006B8C1AF|nr:DUF2280 domain-containing protein [Pseudomonas syringae]KPB29781.1 Uncharacterized protein AC518_2106 [Pseudomonas syringae pv. syringae]MCF5550621.1 DUF2280 domain-containing protein [Pseudomonas syringae]MCH5498843.1 DUF2280 domain-containing protein [Pseudomonas syringae pv. syringae]MCH5525130.1 DUF2280 domain-containing protein [Pseudomonas syringae pv. syringae]MCH5560218.1 DUF2280 domain-containing protein [Pseudomonas syringae pv. syringae]